MEMGSDERMTEYERRRLENIKRNDQMLAALRIHSRLNDLSAVAKRQRDLSKSYKKSPSKKPKTETPVVLRRSLRTRGVPPDSTSAVGLSDDFNDEKQIKNLKLDPSPVKRKPLLEPVPFPMRDAYIGDDGLNQKLAETISQCSKKFSSGEGDSDPCGSVCTLRNSEGIESIKVRKELRGSVDVRSLQLKPDNIARVVPGRIMSLTFFPTNDLQMVAVGNKFGNVGFWNLNGQKEDGDGIYLYHPHSGPISGIIVDPFSICKTYSSCYDGFLRLMDVEKEAFDMVYYGEHSIFALSLYSHNTKSLYFSEGMGEVKMWDVRAGKSLSSCYLHEARINTIDFNSENENVMATSSTDGTACIWDLRLVNADKPTPLTTVSHKRAVHSAYFSPTGKFLATTSIDDKVGLLSGANYENRNMLYHYNQTGRWISSFRGIWGWDDSSIFIGNMKRGVDIISVAGQKIVATLQSDLISAIPCRFDAHPYDIGMLAGATSGGQVYVWTRS